MATDSTIDSTTSSTLAELVAEVPARARAFDRLQLDYCCHGRRSLADACADAGHDPAAVVAALDDLGAPAAGAFGGTLTEMAETIVATHHRYLWDELPALDALAAKVVAAHGTRHAELAEVGRLVGALRADLEPHMRKEEMVLFPAVARIDVGEHDFPFGTIANPVRMMTVEHERVGEVLAALREVTAGYAPPPDGCASYRSLYERLAALEADTHLHIHRENNVLFPAAVAR